MEQQSTRRQTRLVGDVVSTKTRVFLTSNKLVFKYVYRKTKMILGTARRKNSKETTISPTISQITMTRRQSTTSKRQFFIKKICNLTISISSPMIRERQFFIIRNSKFTIRSSLMISSSCLESPRRTSEA